MKIIFRYILNNIRERKLRTAVMLLSIVLSAVLLFVSLCIGDSYEAAQRKMAKGMAGSAAVAVAARTGEGGSQVKIREEAVPDLPEIGRTVGILEAKGLYSEEGYYENFDLLAADQFYSTSGILGVVQTVDDQLPNKPYDIQSLQLKGHHAIFQLVGKLQVIDKRLGTGGILQNHSAVFLKLLSVRRIL